MDSREFHDLSARSGHAAVELRSAQILGTVKKSGLISSGAKFSLNFAIKNAGTCVRKFHASLLSTFVPVAATDIATASTSR